MVSNGEAGLPGGMSSPQPHSHRSWDISSLHFLVLKKKCLNSTLCVCVCVCACSCTHAHSLMSNFLQPHSLQHTRLPCPSLSPRVCSDSSIESVMRYNHLILCSLLLLPSIWPKYQSSSFSISPSNEYSRLLSFNIDWFVLLIGQGTLKSLLQHHNSKPSVLQCSAFFMVQLSHPHTTTVKHHSFDYMDLCQQSDVSAF